MAEQSTVEVGNALIIVAGNHDPFSDGRTTGYLEFYDERHRPAFPLTSHVIRDHLLTIFSEPSTPSLWKAGRFTGWIEALMESAPQTFRSFVAEERMTALQTMEKNRFVRGGNGPFFARSPDARERRIVN